MSVLIEDSPRNLVKWIESAVELGFAEGAVLDPFCSPHTTGNRRNFAETASRIQSKGGSIKFDAMTHMLGEPGTGDFRYYNEYRLWSGAVGDLSSAALISDHLDRVFSHQRTINAPLISPTVLVRSPLGPEALVAVNIASEARAKSDQIWITVAGDEQFWASGARLDAHIGALAQFDPIGWLLVTQRQTGVLPVPVQRQEVEGLARTTRSLADTSIVHVSHGDLTGLPAVAAGASSIGTGWDQKQMIVGAVHYGARTISDGGGWYERPTVRGILARLKKAEFESLNRRARVLAGRVTPGTISPVSPRTVFDHHVQQLNEIVDSIQSESTPRAKYELLRDLYLAAQVDWPAVKAAAISDLGPVHWIDELQAGLELYARGEGW